ncbi:mitogen-activated protein kinase 7-like isoform X1 [Thunnus albacares]|uniref:mitogen-activated protein kinase 7-like isoform X1 n=1 Tax=Thunnus albacares TaxID=8236 RepID=UPI001CF65F64|nr:mitogen-activated protein kinase 7-like isoform X1 [Thunnus albacares]
MADISKTQQLTPKQTRWIKSTTDRCWSQSRATPAATHLSNQALYKYSALPLPLCQIVASTSVPAPVPSPSSLLVNPVSLPWIPASPSFQPKPQSRFPSFQPKPQSRFPSFQPKPQPKLKPRFPSYQSKLLQACVSFPPSLLNKYIVSIISLFPRLECLHFGSPAPPHTTKLS